MSVVFRNSEHRQNYHDFLAKMRIKDCYHQSLAYLLTLDVVCVKHIDDLFDIQNDRIKPNALEYAWQTGTSKKTTRLAFNLWNSYCYDDCDTSVPSTYYSVDYIFCCSYAQYYHEAIKLRYPEYYGR